VRSGVFPHPVARVLDQFGPMIQTGLAHTLLHVLFGEALHDKLAHILVLAKHTSKVASLCCFATNELHPVDTYLISVISLSHMRV